jgi:long-chain acyl-CoA synthetase
MKNRPYPLNPVDNIVNLKQFLSYTKGKYRDATAITFQRKKEQIDISYKQLQADVDSLGTTFLNLGIQNTKIALIGTNSYEWVLAYFATVNSGNVIVPLDKELPASDVKNLVDDSEADIFIFSHDYVDIADYLKNTNSNIRLYIDMNTFSDLINDGCRLLKGGNRRIFDIEIDNNALASLIYTSGTTGMAKGVMLSHKGIVSDVMFSCKNCTFFGVSLLVLPLHHAFALTGGILIMMYYGCNIVINESLKTVANDLVKYKPSNTLLVPLFVETFYKKVWSKAKESNKTKLLKIMIKISNGLLSIGVDLITKLFKSVADALGGEIDVIITGGAPIDANYIKGFRDLGIKILNGYGITECSPVVSVNRNFHYRDNSIGLVLSGCNVKIVDPDDNGNGEIYVKGDILMLGYYKNEKATQEAFDGEWFKTGDMGKIDNDGFLFISGRKKNMIILNNGKNIYPEELEFALRDFLPYIKEAIVCAEGNIITAEVFLDIENYPDCVSQLDMDIIRFNQFQPQYKNIGKVAIRETEFPKTTTKKIKRQYK